MSLYLQLLSLRSTLETRIELRYAHKDDRFDWFILVLKNHALERSNLLTLSSFDHDFMDLLASCQGHLMLS